MRQAFHIFKKDVRQFWYEIAAVLLLLIKFAYDELKETGFVININNLSLWSPLLVVAWCLLIVRVIHAEALPGDRQFWVTRPYDRRSLLAAKILFLLTFISLPLLLVQAVIVVANGYALPAGGLLWSQILLLLVFVLPAAALASVTATLPQFMLSALAVFAGILAIPMWSTATAYDSRVGITEAPFVNNLGPLDWIRVCAIVATILLVAVPILILQFMRRKTTVSRIIAITGTVLGPAIPLFLPWGALLALQSRANPIPSLHIELDRSKSLSAAPFGTGIADLPLSVAGLPEGTELKCDAASVVIDAPQGVRWRSGWIPAIQTAPLKPSGCVVRVLLKKFPFSPLDSAWSQPVKIRASLYLTLFGNKRSAPLPTSALKVAIPGLGQCGFPGVHDLVCGSPFRWPARLAWTHGDDNLDQPFSNSLSYSPFPAALHITPIETFSAKVQAWYGTIALEDPLAHFRYDVEANGVHLGDFPPDPIFIEPAPSSREY